RRIKISQVIRKGQSRGGDGCGESCEERNPAGHEAPGGTEGARQVNILTPGAWKINAQFGVAERTAKCKSGANHPDGKNQRRPAEVSSHESGGGENAHTHHV